MVTLECFPPPIFCLLLLVYLYCTRLLPKSFDKFSKDIYKRFLEMNSNDSSKTSHIENIKKRLMNDKVFKPHFVTNKDYYDIEDK